MSCRLSPQRKYCGYQEEHPFHAPWEASLSTSSSPGQPGTGKAILLALNTCLSKGAGQAGTWPAWPSPFPRATQPTGPSLPLPIRTGTSATTAKGHRPREELRVMEKPNSSWALKSGLQGRFILIIIRSDGRNNGERQTSSSTSQPLLLLFSPSASKCIVLSHALQLSPQLYKPDKTDFSRCCREAMKFYLSRSEFLWLSLCYAYPTDCH